MNFDGRIRADARHLPLADGSVQCVVTSPPYWGLRKYDVDGPQIGNEETPQEWLAEMVAVFREVRRVLKSDGVCWVNIGDSYCHGTGADRKPTTTAGVGVPASWSNRSQPERIRPSGNIKTKDLCLMPQRLAIALQDDGWYVRAEIIWAKGGPMPESVTDRVTRSHEQIWMITKSPKYFYDAEAIKEKASMNSHDRVSKSSFTKGKTAVNMGGRQQTEESRLLSKKRDDEVQSPFDKRKTRLSGVTPKSAPSGSGVRNNESFAAAVVGRVEIRNKRSVWHINSVGYPEAHYATFPPALVEPCILAGSRPGDFVLDPFAGSGTVAMVSEQLGRRWVAVDLGYQELQGKRLEKLQKVLT